MFRRSLHSGLCTLRVRGRQFSSRPQSIFDQEGFFVEEEMRREDRYSKFQREWKKLSGDVLEQMSKKKILCDLSPAERRRVEILTAQLGDLTPDEMHLFLIGMDRQVQKLKKTREIKSKLDLNDFNLFENYEMRTRASLDPKEQFKASVMNKLLMHPEVIAEMQKKFGAAEATTQAEAKKEEKVEAKKDAVPEVESYLRQKKSFNIEMTGFDQTKKIVIIKELKTLTGLGLKETKDLVDKLPSLLFKDLKKDDAEKMADTLKTLGCVVKLV